MTRWMAVKLGVAVGLCVYGWCGMFMDGVWHVYHQQVVSSGTIWHPLAPSGMWHLVSGIWHHPSSGILVIIIHWHDPTPPPYLPSDMHVWVECMGGVHGWSAWVALQVEVNMCVALHGWR